MITLVVLALAGLAVLALTAIVIGLTESRQSGAWRRIAAERRRTWERRQRQLHGGSYGVDAWADEDTD